MPAIAAMLIFAASAVAQDLGCKQFTEIYNNGSHLCEAMWDGAFKVVDNYSEAYTMWFFDEENPNDGISQRLHPQGNTSICNLQFFHKTLPTAEGDDFTECHPWKEASCCSSQTANATNLKISYGPEFHWDRCGSLSPACERFFVQEACFYECSPHIGLYRKWGGHACQPSDPGCSTDYNASDPDHNTWQVHQMPIRKDYCDEWLLACANDMFCSADNGNYFSCARIAPAEATPVQSNEDNKNDSLSPGIIALIVVLVVLVVGLFAFVWVVYCKEKAGKPMFMQLEGKEKSREGLPLH